VFGPFRGRCPGPTVVRHFLFEAIFVPKRGESPASDRWGGCNVYPNADSYRPFGLATIRCPAIALSLAVGVVSGLSRMEGASDDPIEALRS